MTATSRDEFFPTLLYDPEFNGCTFMTADVPDDVFKQRLLAAGSPDSCGPALRPDYCGAPVAYELACSISGLTFFACTTHTAWMRANRASAVASCRTAA